MDTKRIAELLQPFLAQPLSDMQLESISIYIDILQKWNQRINLTAVRDPQGMVTRHFGESLLAAQHLFPRGSSTNKAEAQARVADLGSGAGFPGFPLKIWTPAIHLTLIESNQKKATFLREAARVLKMNDVEVFSGRAEEFHPKTADLVTMRAVERFESVLPTAARLLARSGRMALLIGEAQVEKARYALPSFQWTQPVLIPNSESRILMTGSLQAEVK